MKESLPLRKIIHVDMDAFYASVEQLDHPELRGKPVAVGGNSKRGVVAAASYEARSFGIRSAMSSAVAIKKCPNLIFVTPRFGRYRAISEQIRRIFYEYTDLVEPLSLDEAYLDVTHNKKGNPSGSLIAQEIRTRIYEETGLTASAGISINKFIAKIASDYHKPNGQKTVPPELVLSFLEELEIRKFFGVGKVTAEKMYRLGIFTGKDLKAKSLEFLQEHFGKSGAFYFRAVRGQDISEVKPQRERKSLGAERTFEENISSEVFMIERLDLLVKELDKRRQQSQMRGKTLTLKIKYSDFSVQTRSKTLPYYLEQQEEISTLANELLFQDTMKDSVRLLGLSLSNFESENPLQKPLKNEIGIQLKLEF